YLMGRFREALAAPGLAAIAEIKRRSPSAGDLRPDADPARLAATFERAGAAAVSVLVDERFGGTTADLAAARSATSLPLLAKGFFSRTDELAELRRSGADAVLLLLRDLDDACVRDLMERAAELGLDALVEAHDAEELERAVRLDAPVIGVNARDLDTFEIDRRAQLAIVEQVPRDRVVVAESGIGSRAQGAEAELAGGPATGLARAYGFGKAARWRASSTGRGKRRTRRTSGVLARPRAGSCSPGASRPRTSRRRSRQCNPGRSTRARASRPSRESR